MKERDNYQRIKNIRYIKVTMLPVVIGTHGTIAKELVKGLQDIEISGRVGTIQTAVFLRSVRILRKVLEI